MGLSGGGSSISVMAEESPFLRRVRECAFPPARFLVTRPVVSGGGGLFVAVLRRFFPFNHDFGLGTGGSSYLKTSGDLSSFFISGAGVPDSGEAHWSCTSGGLDFGSMLTLTSFSL